MRDGQFRKLQLDASPADNELVAFNSSDSTWKNQTAAEAGLAALSGATFTGNIILTAANDMIVRLTPTGTGDAALLDLQLAASSTTLAILRLRQGEGDGAANNMGYDLSYDASNGYLVVTSRDTDGSSTDADIFRVLDGTPNLTMIGYIVMKITDTDGSVEGSLWYDASEDKLKFKTAAGVETITST